jgi:hypothetical protein
VRDHDVARHGRRRLRERDGVRRGDETQYLALRYTNRKSTNGLTRREATSEEAKAEHCTSRRDAREYVLHLAPASVESRGALVIATAN